MTAGLGKTVLKTTESDDRIFGEESYHSIALLFILSTLPLLFGYSQMWDIGLRWS